MLFTADLRAFSERLVAKVEDQKEEIVVKEEESAVVETEIKTETKLTSKRVKREPADEEHQSLELNEFSLRKTKRRKKT